MNKKLEKKENLEKLLKIMPLLMAGKGNGWFKTELEKMIIGNEKELSQEGETLHGYSEQNDHYLIINPKVLLIDYDDIPDEKVRDKLKLDCFEMARHRFGRGNHQHSPDFDEYCRYAHLQIENLINYYYYKKFSGDLNKIKRDIKLHNKYAESKIEKADEVGKIGFIYKQWALKNKLKIDSDTHNAALRVCYIRNDLSHRTTYSKLEYNKVLEDYQFQYGPINDITLIKDDNIRTILYRKSQNWDDVSRAVENMKKKILSDL
jgi:hypothetical protein